MPEPTRLTFIEKPASGQHHPLISALFDTLPTPRADWPHAERQAWLQMMETTFTLVYGVADGASAARSAPRPPGGAAAPRAPRPSRARAKPPAPLGPVGPTFFIDLEGFARKRGGDRVMPDEVFDILVDQRGEKGDLGAIVWADDSRGIPKDKQLDIGI